MKSLKNLLLAKSIVAAAVAGSGIAAPTVSHAIAASGPSSGVVCRAGYTADFSGVEPQVQEVCVRHHPAEVRLRTTRTSRPT